MIKYSKKREVIMGILSKLFGKKEPVYDRFEPTEENKDFLKEDFEATPKKKVAPKKEEAVKPVKEEKKPEAKAKAATPAKKEQPKPAEKKVKAEKPADKAQKAEKPAEKKEKAAKPVEKTKKPNENMTKAAKTVEKKAEKPTEKKEKAEPKAQKSVQKAKKEEKVNADIVNAPELEDDSPEVKGAVAVQESKATANGKFDIRRAKDGRYFFSLYASNHAVIAYSQIYTTTKSVNTGINSVISNAPKAVIEDTTLKNATALSCPKWEIYIDKAGQYRFRLYASNGLCVCHASHGYSTKSGCKGGIESIKRFSAEAKVDKSYLLK